MEENINDLLMGPPDAADLMQELASPVTESKTPMSSIRNKAAAIALMSSGDLKQNYDVSVNRIKDGTLQTTRIWSDIEKGVETDSLQGATAILSSPEYSFEEKQRLIRAGKGIYKFDTFTRLAEQGLKEDSPGETVEEENVRVNVSDILDNQMRARADVQGIVNSHAASLDNSSGKAMSDILAAVLMPFGNSVIQARLAKARTGSYWESFKALMLPGTDIRQEEEAFFEIPSDQKAKVLSEIVERIKTNAGVIFPSDNHYAQWEKLQKIASGEEVSRTDEILENLSPVLDAFGIRAEVQAGKLFLRSRKAAAVEKAARGLSKERVDPLYTVPSEVTQKAPVGPSTAPDESLLSRMPAGPNQADAVKRKQIDDLEAEKARLLEDQNLAGRGDIRNLEAERDALRAPDADPKELAKSIKKANPRMSAKEAREEAQKRINDELADYDAKLTRIGQQIEQNRGAAATQQRIADLEKQIEALSKGVPQNAGSVRLTLADEISRIEWNSITGIDNPMSVGNILASTNPGKARLLFAGAIIDSSDEMVRAAYGTDKVEAIAANAMPQAITESGAVTSKVPNIDEEILKRTKADPLDFSPTEVARAQKNLMDRFKNVSGLKVNDAMGGIKIDGDGAVQSVTSVYGRDQGGFLTYKEALEQTKFALREFGAKESDIEILAKDGVSHVPVKASDVGDAPGEYYARLSMPYEIKPLDVGVFDPETVLWNGMDHIPQLMGNRYTGSLTENLVDIASMFSARFSGSATRASDRASGLSYYLIKEAKEFTDKYDKLPAVQQKILHDYLKEANALQLKDNPADLVARGFKPEMMDALKDFRKFWDTHWYLENSDFIRTLNRDGWKKLEHPTEEFIAKEIPPNMWSEVKEFLDPRTGNIETFDDAMRVSINNSKGQLAVLRRPVDINGKTVTHIFVDNNPSSYLRTIREDDAVLSKLDGYYTTVYKAPRFVDEVTYEMVGGRERIVRKQAIAVAGDWETAENFAKTRPQKPGVRYETRGDERAMQTGGDDWFDIHAARGRISQRHRGQPLVDDTGNMNILGNESFVLGPVDSAVRAARSISGRIAGRAHLENAKARFVDQYREFLTPDAFGEYHFPSDISQIGKSGIPSSRSMADARSTWNKIRYLENGYLNAADTVVKQMFNVGSIMAGKYKLSRTERALGSVAELAPMAAFKSVVFNTLVGTNFLRNWIIQSAQLARVPAYLFSPAQVAKTMARVTEFTTDLAMKRESHFTKFVHDSDLLKSIDHQNMVRGSIQNAMDHSNKVMNYAMKPVMFLRRVGFDAGESANMLGHLAAVYERYKALGKNLDSPRVRSEAFAEVRHLTGNMNFGGDFAYNQTAAAAILQFAQAPHKFLLQYANRALPLPVRLRLLAWDLFMYGLPTAAVFGAFGEDLFPEDMPQEERVNLQRKIADGFLATNLNKMIGAEALQDKRVDVSSMAPNNMMGQYELFKAILTGGADEMMAHTPGGSLFGEQGGVQRAIRMWSQMFKGVVSEDQTPVELSDAMLATGRILPLVNNAYKAYIIQMYHERRNSKGITVESGLPDSHIYFQLFGFGSKNLSEIYELSKKLSEATKENKDNFNKVYKHSLEIMAGVDTKSADDLEKQIRITNFLMKPYMDQPWAMKQLQENLNRDLTGMEMNNFMRLMKLGGMPSTDETRRIIEQHPGIPEGYKKPLIDRMQTLIDSEE